jgi:RNA ligase (TIGR02306 family)
VSTFKCEVVPVELQPHPNAERLSIVRVFGYDVCVRTSDWQGRDRGIYVPVDAVVDTTRLEFAFLAGESKDGKYRIKAKRLRGTFSMGLLVPIPPRGIKPVAFADEDEQIGTDWTEELGVTKYEEPEVIRRGGAFPMQGAHDAGEQPPGHTVKYTDIEHVRRHGGVFYPGELVAVTEKIHGANARYTYRDGQIHVGSRNQWKKPEESSGWWRALTVPMLRLCTEESPLILFGEVYGQGIQDLAYGTATPRFVAFDLYDPEADCYLDYPEFRAICLRYRVPMAPLLYVGAYDADAIKTLSERDSVVAGNGQISEGVVVRPLYERRDNHLGRVVLKLPGERYLLRQEKAA